MGDGRFVCSQFCDDIRQEVGNKFSLIGCYGAVMYVSAVPTVLPKLCVQVKAFTPVDRPFAKLVLRVLRDDQTLIELSATPEPAASPNADRPSRSGGQIVNALVVMSPFAVEAPCQLRVAVETEDGTLDGGALYIDERARTKQ